MRTRAVWCGVLVVALAACGGGDDDDTGGAADTRGDGGTETPAASASASGGGGTGGDDDRADACRFITTEEAAELLGEEVSEPTQAQTPEIGDTNAAAACTYRGAAASIQVVVSTVDDPSEFVPDQNAIDVGAESVSGIGDDAYVSAGSFSIMAVRVGSDIVLIFPSRPDRDFSRDELIELGRTAADRM